MMINTVDIIPKFIDLEKEAFGKMCQYVPNVNNDPIIEEAFEKASARHVAILDCLRIISDAMEAQNKRDGIK